MLSKMRGMRFGLHGSAIEPGQCRVCSRPCPVEPPGIALLLFRVVIAPSMERLFFYHAAPAAGKDDGFSPVFIGNAVTHPHGVGQMLPRGGLGARGMAGLASNNRTSSRGGLSVGMVARTPRGEAPEQGGFMPAKARGWGSPRVGMHGSPPPARSRERPPLPRDVGGQRVRDAVA